jgi:hypothetical protein
LTFRIIADKRRGDEYGDPDPTGPACSAQITDFMRPLPGPAARKCRP